MIFKKTFSSPRVELCQLSLTCFLHLFPCSCCFWSSCSHCSRWLTPTSPTRSLAFFLELCSLFRHFFLVLHHLIPAFFLDLSHLFSRVSSTCLTCSSVFPRLVTLVRGVFPIKLTTQIHHTQLCLIKNLQAMFFNYWRVSCASYVYILLINYFLCSESLVTWLMRIFSLFINMNIFLFIFILNWIWVSFHIGGGKPKKIKIKTVNEICSLTSCLRTFLFATWWNEEVSRPESRKCL